MVGPQNPRARVLLSSFLAFIMAMASSLNVYLLSLNGDWSKFDPILVVTAFLGAMLNAIKDWVAYLAKPPELTRPQEPEPEPRVLATGNRVATRRIPEPEPETFVDMRALRRELERDEGVRYQIYKDSEGHPTLGIGHLINPSDPEYGQPIGTPVSHETVERYYQQDVHDAIDDVRHMFPVANTYPMDFRLVLVNLMFNLGYQNLALFRKFRRAVDKRDWQLAAAELKDSKWYRQVGTRGIRIVARVGALATDLHKIA